MSIKCPLAYLKNRIIVPVTLQNLDIKIDKVKFEIVVVDVGNYHLLSAWIIIDTKTVQTFHCEFIVTQIVEISYFILVHVPNLHINPFSV